MRSEAQAADEGSPVGFAHGLQRLFFELGVDEVIDGGRGSWCLRALWFDVGPMLLVLARPA